MLKTESGFKTAVRPDFGINTNSITIKPQATARRFMGFCQNYQYMLGHSRNGVTDEILDMLSHPIRRRLLFSLYEQSHDASELPLHRVSGLAFEEENTQTALYHMHLPKLEEKGYVRYDSDEHTITKGPEWDQIEPLLKLIHNHLNELPQSIRGTRSMP